MRFTPWKLIALYFIGGAIGGVIGGIIGAAIASL